jgi:hypothetical protein
VPVGKDDLEARGRILYDLRNAYAPLPFSSGLVPTGPAFDPGSSGFLEGVVRIFPEIAEDAERMKWMSVEYEFAGLIFFKPQRLFPGWTGVGIVTAEAGDGSLNTEWIFASTGGQPPKAFYTPAPGVLPGRYGSHTNELAAKAFQVRELGAVREGKHARLPGHHPSVAAFAEADVRAKLRDKQDVARRRSRTKK